MYGNSWWRLSPTICSRWPLRWKPSSSKDAPAESPCGPRRCGEDAASAQCHLDGVELGRGRRPSGDAEFDSLTGITLVPRTILCLIVRVARFRVPVEQFDGQMHPVSDRGGDVDGDGQLEGRPAA